MGPKKIGFYLIEDQVCDAAAVDQALRKQAELELLGQYKSTSQIMVEGGHIAPAGPRGYCPPGGDGRLLYLVYCIVIFFWLVSRITGLLERGLLYTKVRVLN